jgi:serine/threonine protein kinase
LQPSGDGYPGIVGHDIGQLAPGDLFAGCRIESVAGHGAMGLVYKAHQLRPQRPVAVKVITPALAGQADFRTRFEQEASLAARIEHPNVIPIYAVGDESGLLYIVMRFVKGTDLAKLLRSRGRLAPLHAANIVAQIASALDAAHACGLVHRDIKPANVLVSNEPGEHIYLTDFGLTKRVTDPGGGPTPTGGFVGTLDYIAPEQVSAEPVDARADIYSLGCVLYQLITGSVPFPREGEVATIFAHLSAPPPRPSCLVPDSPAALDAVIEQALAKDRADRFPTAGELATAALAAVQATVGPTPSSEVAKDIPELAPLLGGAGVTPSPVSTSRALDRHRRNRTESIPRIVSVRGRPVVPAPNLVAHSGVGLAEASALPDESDLLSPDESADIVTPDGPQPAPITGTRPLRASARYVRMAVVSAATLIAIAVLIVLTRATAPPSSGINTARSGLLTLGYRSPWRAVETASPVDPELAAVSFSGPDQPISLSAGDVALAGGTLAYSALAPGGPPPQVVRRYGPPVAPGSATIGGTSARRYEWRPDGGEELIAFVIPTVSSDIAILCAAATAHAAGLKTCTDLASTARTSGVQLLPPLQEAALAKILTRDLGPVAYARHRTAALGASRLQARSATASHIARVERSGLRALSRLAAPPRDREAVAVLRAALLTEASGFGVLGRAAAGDDRSGYAAARQQVLDAGTRLEAAIVALNSRGLTTPTLRTLELAALPPKRQPKPAPGPAAGQGVGSTVSPPAGPPSSTPEPTPAHHSGGVSVVPSRPVYSSP